MVKLFNRCLTITNSVEVCRLYVSYVRRVNDTITGGERARGTVIQAFDFAVNKVGIDVASGDLWNDYLEFLKSWTPAATWEQQQKVDLIRKVYKRCLVIPTTKIETLWTGYTKFENDVNVATASKFIAERSTEFMDARSWHTEWNNSTRQLRRDVLPYTLQSHRDYITKQLKLWFKWIELEKKNALNLKEDTQVQQRIEYVYKQAISTLPFVPEIWFRYIKFTLGNNDEASLSKCIDAAQQGVVLNPRSFLVAFQLSELFEKDANYAKAAEVLNKLVTVYREDEEKLAARIEAIKKVPEVEEKDDKSDDEDNIKPVPQISASDADRLLSLEEKHEEISRLVTLVYTKLMMFSKRSQGIKEARAVFKQAREEFKNVGYEFYVENAKMEYYSDKQKTADKVFKLAQKNFSKNGEFLLAYLDYLILTNSVEEMRVFFESAVTALLKEISSDKEELLKPLDPYQKVVRPKNIARNEAFMRQIIQKYIRFATNYLDIDTVKSLESRYEQFFPEDDPMVLFADRYRDHDLNVIKRYDLFDENEVEVVHQKKKRRVVFDDDVPEREPAAMEAPVVVESHGFIGNTVYNLLLKLPNAGFFGPPQERVFNSAKLVELFSNLPDLD